MSKGKDHGTTRVVERHEIFSGVRWTGVGQVTTEAVRMLVSVVLANLLVPEDFGLLSMASVVTGFIMIFQYLGTSGVIIQRKELPETLVSSLFWLNVTFSLLLSILLAIAAPWLAELYHQPSLVPIIQVLSGTFVITAIGAVPGALLNRHLRFDRMAQVALASAVVQGVSAIILARMDYGVWALVISNVLSSLVSTAIMWWVSDWKPRFIFSTSEVKQVAGFCLNMTGVNLVDYFSRDSDKFIIGKWLGDASLGQYTMAYRFCLYPPLAISPILNRVLFATFARIQDDIPQLRMMALRSIGGIAFITFPMIAGIMAVADPFVHALLNDKWTPAIMIIIALGPVGAMQAITTPANYVLLAKNKTAWLFWLSFISGAVTAIAMFATLQWGVVWVAFAYTVISIPLTIVRFELAMRLIKLPFTGLLKVLAPYFTATLVMTAAVYLVRFAIERFGIHPLLDICITVPVGAIVYAVLMLLWKPPAVYDFIDVLPTQVKPLAAKIFHLFRDRQK